MDKNPEVGVYIDVLPNGKKTMRIVGKHIPEDLKNELYRIIGHKAKYIKVVAEECDLNLPTSQK